MIISQVCTQSIVLSGAIELEVNLEEVDPEYICLICSTITVYYTILILVRKLEARKVEKSHKSSELINVRVVT